MMEEINLNIKSNLELSSYPDFKIYTLANDCMGRDIINGKGWEPHIVDFLRGNLFDDSIFIDVGSNYGWHSIVASKLCKNVYSFEPQKVMFNIQQQSIIENNINNILLYNLGLGDEHKFSEMSKIDYLTNGVNIGDLSVGSGGEKIEIKTLDSFNFEKVDLIKIDVQGYEKFVIDGCLDIINKHKPIIILEFEDHQLRKFGYDSKYLFEKIKSLDYDIYFLEYVYPSDHVCVHKSLVNDFESKNKISLLTENNTLNMNLHNGITKKIIK